MPKNVFWYSLKTHFDEEELVDTLHVSVDLGPSLITIKGPSARTIFKAVDTSHFAKPNTRVLQYTQGDSHCLDFGQDFDPSEVREIYEQLIRKLRRRGFRVREDGKLEEAFFNNPFLALTSDSIH